MLSRNALARQSPLPPPPFVPPSRRVRTCAACWPSSCATPKSSDMQMPLVSVAFMTALALLAADYVFGSGRFSKRNLVAATVAQAIHAAVVISLPVLQHGKSLRAAFEGKATVGKKSWEDHKELPGKERTFDGHYFAGLARWNMLVESEGAPAGDDTEKRATMDTKQSRLIAHLPADPFCPCPDCTDKDIAFVLWRGMPISILFGVGDLLVTIAFAWTAIVTLGAFTWNTGWSLFLAILFVVSCALYYPMVELRRAQLFLGRFQQLAHRVRHRAVYLVLSDFLARCRAGALAPQQDPPEAEEPYARLHADLIRAWTSQHADLSNMWFLLILLGTATLAGIVTAAVGGCIAAWIPLLFGVYSMWLITAMLLVSAGNAQISDVAKLYAEARMALRRMIVSGRYRASESELQKHEAQLALFGELDHVRGRWMGFTVDYGTTRALAIAAFTVALGLWTLLRGAGISFVMDNVCPGP
ncbi:hypothetical protein DFJ74DRAFT_312996 [Hyaloraphidium curvatum]|nr:hypothetical protein DFJ74DRAFT_312996 [Hyaloraphidium curvatum]